MTAKGERLQLVQVGNRTLFIEPGNPWEKDFPMIGLG